MMFFIAPLALLATAAPLPDTIPVHKPADVAIAATATQEASVAPPPGHPLEGIETRTLPWPGRQSAEDRSVLRADGVALVAAMNAGDSSAIARHRAILERGLGRYVGEPEDRAFYGQPVDPSTPDLNRVVALWADQHQRLNGRYPWNEAAAMRASGRVPGRLRTTSRIARAHLHVYEANVPGRDAYLQEAIAAADYLLTVQADNGVFGYPYDPAATEGLRGVAARFVLEARARGFNVAANGWVVDDLQTGELNFDNGLSGLFLLHIYRLTGDDRYLQSAKRAGEWAMGRNLVANYNYNGFNGQLLSRLYRLTGEQRYLDRARWVFEYGVMSGQLDNGRWFDQHNAKIQYHAIMMSQLAEFQLALRQADDPFAATVESALVRGLDNMALEITSNGSSNTHEMLAVDALVFGSRVLGGRDLWTRAINVDMNFLLNQFQPKLQGMGSPLPEPVGTYILFAQGNGPTFAGMDSVVGPFQPVTP